MESDTYLSLYLKSNTLRVFKSTLRLMGTPEFVQFSVHTDGNSMMLVPYHKKSFTSFRVPKNIYDDQGSLKVHSKGMCRLLANRLNWNVDCSYRVPGKYFQKQNMIIYNLSAASVISSLHQT